MSETMMSQANENTENVDQKALELAQSQESVCKLHPPDRQCRQY